MSLRHADWLLRKCCRDRAEVQSRAETWLGLINIVTTVRLRPEGSRRADVQRGGCRTR
jgi:hypothetical protein